MASVAETVQCVPGVSDSSTYLVISHDDRKDDEAFRQFARIDSGFLAWDFWLKDKDDRELQPP